LIVRRFRWILGAYRPLGVSPIIRLVELAQDKLQEYEGA
jgi:hypothetical protein